MFLMIVRLWDVWRELRSGVLSKEELELIEVGLGLWQGSALLLDPGVSTEHRRVIAPSQELADLGK
jgi:hypothetical protein